MNKSTTKNPEEFSAQMKRLYAAAKKLRSVEGKSAVANLLNISPQNLNNWENGRPISYEGLVKAQDLIGCDAIWLRDGTGEMTRRGIPDEPDLNDVAQLVSLYAQANKNGRKAILDLAQVAPKIALARDGGISSDQSK